MSPIFAGNAKDRFSVHKAILKKLNYVLDMESASSFPDDVEVVYSWGKNTYHHTQFIHRSGTTLVQIAGDGDFLLVANRLSNDRSMISGRLEKVEANRDRRIGGLIHSNSPFSSPIVRPVMETKMDEKRLQSPTVEDIKLELESFCENVPALKQFYNELNGLQPSITPVPRTGPLTDTTIPISIPSLKLPSRGDGTREPSPSRT